jgi:hypothetical protein
MDVTLTRAGILVHRPDRAPVSRRPRTLRGLLAHWQARVERIEDGFTLGDLIELLRGVRRIETISAMVSCDVGSLLEEAALPPIPRSPGGPTLRYLRVENRLTPSSYVPHPADKSPALVDRPGGGKEIVAGEKHGFWTGPYRIQRDLVARCENVGGAQNRFAVELTGVQLLLDLPLRYFPEAVFSDSLRLEGGFRTEISITFGELLTAVLGTIGRFGSEAERQDTLRAMEAGFDDDEEPDRGGGGGGGGTDDDADQPRRRRG